MKNKVTYSRVEVLEICIHLLQLQENSSIINHVSSIPWELEELRCKRKIRKLE